MSKCKVLYKSWLVRSAVGLMVLVTWSRVSDTEKLSNTRYAHLQARRRGPWKGPDAPPVLAYWILGSRGETRRMMRLLKAIYHPRNHYLLQLDSASSYHERVELSILTHSERVFEEFGNVDVVGQSYGVNPMAALLHAAALLLRIRPDWDWFIPLSTSDYPIMPQDDILYAFSSLPREVIFMGYNNTTSFDKRHNVSQIAVDPNLYLKEKSSVFYAAETREKPDAFEIFGGSPWMVLTRGFLEHCVTGLDNLPRKLLMYFNNVVFPLESYFQTVLCNSPDFQSTILVNDDLRRHTAGDPSMAVFAILSCNKSTRSCSTAVLAGLCQGNGATRVRQVKIFVLTGEILMLLNQDLKGLSCINSFAKLWKRTQWLVANAQVMLLFEIQCLTRRSFITNTFVPFS